MSTNVNFVCTSHAPKPRSKYSRKPVGFFLEKHVKIAFPARHPVTGKDTFEHMWVKVLGFEGRRLIGQLDNNPVFDTGVKLHDQVTLLRSEIEDVYAA
jgi:uncharacterized protein YegJ (DUF2314 family)